MKTGYSDIQVKEKEWYVRWSYKKKPRLCDVIEQSNEQIKQMQEIMQSNSITSDTLSRKREEDQEFFWQMMFTMSQTMMWVTQMLMQGAAPRVPSTKSGIYTSKLQLFIKWMVYGFYSPPAR